MVAKIIDICKTLIIETYNETLKHNLPLQSAAIAFYTIFSAAPIVLIILTSSKFILGNDAAIDALTNNLNQITGSDIAQSLIHIAKTAGQHHSSVIASVIGWTILIFAASTVVSQLQSSLNAIWGVEYPKINSALLYIINRIISLAFVFVLLSLMITSVLAVSQLGYLHNIFPHFPIFLGDISHLISVILSIIISILFFALIFKLLPDVHARWRDILVGACVTTVLFLFGKFLVDLYLDNSTMQMTYKAAGSFIVFLIWIYYNSLVMLVGAEFTETYTKMYGEGIEKSLNSELLNWRSYF